MSAPLGGWAARWPGSSQFSPETRQSQRGSAWEVRIFVKCVAARFDHSRVRTPRVDRGTSAQREVRRADRRAKQVARAQRLVDRYPLSLVPRVVIVTVVLSLLWWNIWQVVLYGVVALAFGLWYWLPYGAGRERLAAQQLGFFDAAKRPPVSAEARAFLIAAAVCLVTVVGVGGFLAVEHSRMPVACPTPDGYNYGDARWSWFPPGPTCAAVPDAAGRIIPQSPPSSWRYALYLGPLIALAAAVRPGRRWWGANSRVVIKPWQLFEGATGDENVGDFYRDPRRQRSPETDYGFPWSDGLPGGWMLRWLADTGELIGLHWQPSQAVPMTSGGVPRFAPRIDAVAILLVEPSEQTVATMLRDRRRFQSQPYGWEWVRSRAEQA